MTLRDEVETEIILQKRNLIKKYAAELLSDVRIQILNTRKHVDFLMERENEILSLIDNEDLEGLEKLFPKSNFTKSSVIR